MEVISIEGIVVNTLKYGENSKIINVLTTIGTVFIVIFLSLLAIANM